MLALSWVCEGFTGFVCFCGYLEIFFRLFNWKITVAKHQHNYPLKISHLIIILKHFIIFRGQCNPLTKLSYISVTSSFPESKFTKYTDAADTSVTQTLSMLDIEELYWEKTHSQCEITIGLIVSAASVRCIHASNSNSYEAPEIARLQDCKFHVYTSIITSQMQNTDYLKKNGSGILYTPFLLVNFKIIMW